jgi:hypothetical protein
VEPAQSIADLLRFQERLLMLSRKFDGIAKNVLGVALLSLLCTGWGSDVRCQTPSAPKVNPKGLYGGIEIALRTVRAVAIQVAADGDRGQIKILGSDQITPATAILRDESPSSEYIVDLAQSVQKLSAKLQRDFRVPLNQIYILGLSELDAQFREGLAKEVRNKSSKEITFLDAKSETELGIVGNIPRRYQVSGKSFDNRTVSVLLDIGSTSIKGGYELLRQKPGGRAEYDYSTWETPIKGLLQAATTQSPTQTAGQTSNQGPSPTSGQGTGPLSGQMAGLMTRKKVYLTGDIVQALVTLLYPENQNPYISFTMEDIDSFYNRAVADPESLLNPDLSKIRDENLRIGARKGREAIKALYTPKGLSAGAKALKSVASELALADKQLIFARNSNWARILGYVRLQIE